MVYLEIRQQPCRAILGSAGQSEKSMVIDGLIVPSLVPRRAVCATAIFKSVIIDEGADQAREFAVTQT